MSFRKYFIVITTSLKEDTVYPVSVLAWRIRNVLRVLVIYALWSSLFSDYGRFADYSREMVLTYILLTMVIQAVVLSSRTVDVSSDIGSGDISNILLKPVNYFIYYFFQDIGNKGLNLIFSIIEFSTFLYFLKPPFFLQTDPGITLAFILSLVLAVFVYFFLNLILGFIAFYTPENVWAPRFLFYIILEFLAGALFPLDVLPHFFYKFLMFTPFPYLLYFPTALYLGRLGVLSVVSYGLIGFSWVLILLCLAAVLWRRGLKAYEAWGR